MLKIKEKMQLRKLAHNKKPVVLMGAKGLSLAVHQEIERALLDHELIKIKIISESKQDSLAICEKICHFHQAESIQLIGKILTVYRKNPDKHR